MISVTKDNMMLGYKSLGLYPDISHFVTTRQGGCSEGSYASFNCTPYTGDAEADVRRNQQLLMSSMDHPPKELVIPYQVHGTKCLLIDTAYSSASSAGKQAMLQGVDAVITDMPEYCLCISTADCVPVLLYDRTHQVVAAVHAGWRGTAERILLGTLARMHEEYGTAGEDVVACIGPSISLASFEVGNEVYEAFEERNFDMERISSWKPESHKYHIDLWEANRMQLLQFGVGMEQIELAGICTYIHFDEFFSARRLGVKSGRILSGIMLNSH